MKKITIFLILILFIYQNSVFPWENFDMVIAVVNDTPIIESEVLSEFERLKKLKRISRGGLIREKSMVLDQFIENAIVVQTANDESIIISEKKIDNHIEKILEQTKMSLEDFKKKIESKQKISFKEYREELKISLKREQVITIAIGVSPPSNEEAMAWYKRNSKKLGYQVKIKHILIRPRNRSIAEEKRVNNLVKELRSRVLAGESFEALARKYSEDSETAGKGGFMDWVLLAELDPYFASHVFGMSGYGKISMPIKSLYGYHLVKFLARRATPFDEVKDKIFHLLFQKKLAVQFKKWVSQKRRVSDIKIYMKDYVSG